MKLSALVEAVRETDEEVMITRNGSPAAILVSPNEFDGWRETLAIQADPDFMHEIKKGIAALRRGGLDIFTLEELYDPEETSGRGNDT